jgi:tetratricopeptide (TPR) repeat protein
MLNKKTTLSKHIIGAFLCSIATTTAAQDNPKESSDKLDPVVVYTTLVGEVAADREDYVTALGYYLHASKLSKDPKIAERTTEIALRAGSASAALESAGIWADAAVNDPQAQVIAATLYLKFNTAEQAKPYLSRITELSTKEVAEAAITIRSQLTDATEYHNFENAANLLMQQKKTANTLFLYAFTQEALEKYPNALTAIDESLALNPESPQLIAMRVQILRDDNKAEDALNFTQQSIKKYPAQEHLKWIYAEQLMDLGKTSEAEKYYNELTKTKDYRADSLVSLAKIAIEKEQLSKAEEYLNSILSEYKNPNAAYYYLGRVAQLQGKTQVAISWFTQVSEGTYFLTAQVQASLLMAKTGEADKALQRLIVLENTFPAQGKYLALAKTQVLLDANQYEHALSMLDKVMASVKNDKDLYYAHGLVASKLGRIDVAENDLNEVLKQNPNHVESLNILAYTLANYTERYSEALEHAKKANELAPNDPFVMDSLGYVYYRMGNYSTAIGYFNKAFAATQDPDIAAHLGEALWNNGQKVQAKQIWHDALQTAPSNHSLQEVVQRFENE